MDAATPIVRAKIGSAILLALLDMALMVAGCEGSLADRVTEVRTMWIRACNPSLLTADVPGDEVGGHGELGFWIGSEASKCSCGAADRECG